MSNWLKQLYEDNIVSRIYTNRLKHRLALNKLASRNNASTMTVNCSGSNNCQNDRCSNFIQLYSGFYGRLYRGPFSNPPLPTHQLTMHGISLGEYENFDVYKNDLGKRSSFFLRHVKRAIKNGFFIEPFNPANHSIDMVAIHRSMKIRSFGVMLDAIVTSVNDFGGIPKSFHEIEQLHCVEHWEKNVGVFLKKTGYKQGSLVVDKQLIGYARLHRIGNMLAYKDFIGNGRYLSDGVMKLLHIEIVRMAMDANNQDFIGIQNIAHGSIERGSNGLFFWKKKALFSPYIVKMIEPDLPKDFDSSSYIAHNPDVNKSRLSPELHYKIHGHRENRRYK